MRKLVLRKQVLVAPYPMRPALSIRPLPPLGPCLLRRLPCRLTPTSSGLPSCNSVNCSVPLQLGLYLPCPRRPDYPSVKLTSEKTLCRCKGIRGCLPYIFPGTTIFVHSPHPVTHIQHRQCGPVLEYTALTHLTL